VTVEKRGTQSWCVLDAQVTAYFSVSPQVLIAVIQDLDHYTSTFSKITEASWVQEGDAFLLAETVVVTVLGIRNVNHFRLKIEYSKTINPDTFTQSWTQDWTDGTIDSLWGSWVFIDVGTPAAPRTKVIYHSHSAVPDKLFGQSAIIQLFLGSETKAAVEAVAKMAGAG